MNGGGFIRPAAGELLGGEADQAVSAERLGAAVLVEKDRKWVGLSLNWSFWN